MRLLIIIHGKYIFSVFFYTAIFVTNGYSEIISDVRNITEEDFLREIPIVLSASRMSQRTIEAPASVTVIDREMIESAGFIEVADLLRLVPGFQVSYVNGNVLAVTYHGVSFDFPRKLQVLIDGRSVYRPLLSNVDWTSLGVAISDIDRIEIVRGPNTTTYGTNAFLGTINIITRPPFQYNRGLQLESTIGSVGVAKTIFKYASSSKNFDYRTTLSYRRDNGFDDVDDARKVGFASFRGVYDLTPKSAIDMQLGYSEGDLGTGGIQDIFNPVRDKKVVSYYGFMQWTQVFSEDEEIRVQFYYNYYEQDDIFNTDLVSNILGVNPSDVPLIFNGQPDQFIQFGIFDGTTDRTDIEIQHYTKLKKNLRIVWGASVRQDRLKGEKVILDKPGYETDTSKRLFSNTEWYASRYAIYNFGFNVEHNDIVGAKFSPRLAFNYLLSKTQTLRLSATKAFRSPSLYEANNKWTVRFNDGELIRVLYDHEKNIEAEELISYELGYILELPSPSLSLSMKLFKEDLTNFITAPFDPTYPQPVFPVNVGDTRAKIWKNGGGVKSVGLEAQLNYRPNNDISFVFNYAYAQAKGLLAAQLNPNQFDDLSDNIPKHTISALFDIKFAHNWRSSISLFRVGDMEWGGNGDFVDGYNRMDFHISKSFKSFGHNSVVKLIVQNLLDDEYQEFRIENNFGRRAYIQIKINE